MKRIICLISLFLSIGQVVICQDESERLKLDFSVHYQPFRHWQFTGAFGHFNPGDIDQINFKDPKDSLWFSFQILLSLY